MATCIRSRLSPFYTIPIFPLKSKEFSPFFCTVHTTFYTRKNILPEAIYCCLHTCFYVTLLDLCYVHICTPTFIATIIGIFIHFKERLPEAICCCL